MSQSCWPEHKHVQGFKGSGLVPQNYLARNFYNLRFLALFVAFAINFILLFYKVKLSQLKPQRRRRRPQLRRYHHLSGDGRLLRRRGPVERPAEKRGGGRGGRAGVLHPAGEHRLHGAGAPLPGHPAHHHILPVCGGVLLPEGTTHSASRAGSSSVGSI